jgi:fluoride exporter
MGIMWIAIFGALGTLGRFGFSRLAESGSVFPIATFGINVLGCFAMGLVQSGYGRSMLPGFWLPTAITVGLLGGFTTFSAYAFETSRLLLDGKLLVGVCYGVGTPVACVLATCAALWMTKWF